MASPASRKRNTARMDGNAAYDLRSTAAEEYLYSAAPVDLPHAPRPTETVVPESAPRPKQAIAPMAVLGFAIAAVGRALAERHVALVALIDPLAVAHLAAAQRAAGRDERSVAEQL